MSLEEFWLQLDLTLAEPESRPNPGVLAAPWGNVAKPGLPILGYSIFLLMVQSIRQMKYPLPLPQVSLSSGSLTAEDCLVEGPCCHPWGTGS